MPPFLPQRYFSGFVFGGEERIICCAHNLASYCLFGHHRETPGVTAVILFKIKKGF
jgi:hypothetical protein